MSHLQAGIITIAVCIIAFCYIVSLVVGRMPPRA